MTAPTTGDGFGVGIIDSSDLNTKLVAPIDFLLDPPRANLRRASTQTLTTATATAIQFDTEDVDTVNGHDNATNPSRYTFQYPGRYWIAGGVGYVAGATGRRGAWWRVNGTDLNASGAMIQSTAASPCIVVARPMMITVNASDYLELIGYHEQGVNLNTSGTTFEQPSMSVLRVGL